MLHIHIRRSTRSRSGIRLDCCCQSDLWAVVCSGGYFSVSGCSFGSKCFSWLQHFSSVIWPGTYCCNTCCTIELSSDELCSTFYGILRLPLIALYFFISLEAERLIRCGVRRVPWLRIPCVIALRELFLGSSKCYFLSLKEYVLLPTIIVMTLVNFCIMVFEFWLFVFELLNQERLVSDQKQFSYKCRCSFLEVNNLDFFVKLLNVAMSLSCRIANAFCLSAFFPCFVTDIRRSNRGFTRSKPEEPWGRSILPSFVVQFYNIVSFSTSVLRVACLLELFFRPYYIADERWPPKWTTCWESDWGICHML